MRVALVKLEGDTVSWMFVAGEVLREKEMLEEKKKCDMILHYITLYIILYIVYLHI